MSKAFNARVEGLSGVLKKIDAYSTKLGDQVNKELDDGVKNMAAKARSLAPHGRDGQLQSSIGFTSIERYKKEFFALAPYAAYVEFGTGSNVFKNPYYAFSPEQRDFAKQFYVNGMGRMPASPFMFPAFESEKVEIIKRIRAVLIKDTRI